METPQLLNKKPIADTLRAMKVGDVEKFPMTQYASVRNTPYNALTNEVFTQGYRYNIRRIDGEVVVTRTA